MGQAASMCRFKGCRYKKSKSGLQLRSIEEPLHHSASSSAGAGAGSVGAGSTVSHNHNHHIINSTNPAHLSKSTTSTSSSSGSSSGSAHSSSASQHRMAAERGAPVLIGPDATGSRPGAPQSPRQHNHHLGTTTCSSPSKASFASASTTSANSNAATSAAGAANPTSPTAAAASSNSSHQSHLHHNNHHCNLHQHHHHHHYNHHSYSHQQHLHLHHQQQPSPAEVVCCSSTGYDPEYARMESWMDENPEFVHDYFIRKAPRQIVDTWLVSHATSGLSSSSSASSCGHGSAQSASAACAAAGCCSGSSAALAPSAGGASAAAAAAASSGGHSNAFGQYSCCCTVTPPGGATVGAGVGCSQTDNGIIGGHIGCGQSCSSHSGSGATTPVRKISAHEFERGGLLKPIVNTIDGTPTFLSLASVSPDATSGSTAPPQYHCGANHPSASSSCGPDGGAYAAGGSATASGSEGGQQTLGSGGGNFGATRPQRMSRNELRHLDEKQLIFELVKDICNELDVRSLCHKILQNVSILLKADRGSLFLVEGRIGAATTTAPTAEAAGSSAEDGDGGAGVAAGASASAADSVPKKFLVSKLFDVCPRSTVADMEANDEVCVAWGTGIAGYVADSGEPVNIPDAYADARFSDAIDSRTGYRTQALLCMPIKDSGGEVLGVAQVINKLNGDRFTETDEKVFASYLQFCGIGLRNAQLYEQSQLEIKRNQVLLDLARMIFEEQSTIEHMVLRILTHMQSLIQCQRVQILLVHEASKGSFSRVFDFEANDLCKDDCLNRTSPFESRFPINIGVTGHVATTGETVNIDDAYADHRFDASVDDGQLFKHRNILCMAIKNSLGQIIGVIQLVNKFNRLNFTRNDENFVEAFAIFCGMGIHNTHMYEKAIVAMAKQSVTLEVLSYHATATVDDAGRLKSLKVPSAAHFQLHDFKFDDILMDDDDTLKACLRMFLDMDFVNRFHIDYEVLCRWLLSVKKNYRNVTYHNWRHAFNVAQMMFSILTSTQWWKIFGEIECLALIIACLCHDLDHRGTNNSFQIKASSPLAQLYSTSTMEHHHFDQCLMILNSPGNQVLGNLSSDDYSQVVHVLEDAILSTDLAVYFRKRGPFLQAVGTVSGGSVVAGGPQAAGVSLLVPSPPPLQQPSMGYWCADEPRQLLRAMSMTVCDLSAITKPWEIEKRTADLVSSEFFEQGDIERQELNITPIDIMNREMEDQLPMMQVGFIDSICMPIYEAFSVLSLKLVPLIDGVRDNKQHWLQLAEAAEAKKKSPNTAADEPSTAAAASSSSSSSTNSSDVVSVVVSSHNSLNKLKHLTKNNNNNNNNVIIANNNNRQQRQRNRMHPNKPPQQHLNNELQHQNHTGNRQPASQHSRRLMITQNNNIESRQQQQQQQQHNSNSSSSNRTNSCCSDDDDDDDNDDDEDDIASLTAMTSSSGSETEKEASASDQRFVQKRKVQAVVVVPLANGTTSSSGDDRGKGGGKGGGKAGGKAGEQ